MPAVPPVTRARAIRVTLRHFRIGCRSALGSALRVCCNAHKEGLLVCGNSTSGIPDLGRSLARRDALGAGGYGGAVSWLSGSDQEKPWFRIRSYGVGTSDFVAGVSLVLMVVYAVSPPFVSALVLT